MIRRVIRLEGMQSNWSRHCDGILRGVSMQNVFNPSVCRFQSRTYLAFRAFDTSHSKPFHAYLCHFDERSENVEVTDLTKHYCLSGVNNVADPKLVTLGNELWVTFNTGWSKTSNQIYLARVAPSLGKPIECHFAGRRQVEKNWAFVLRDRSLIAIYSLDGPRLLSAPFDTNSSQLTFEQWDRGNSRIQMSIGSQVAEHNGDLVLIAHEKWPLLNRRAYIARPVTFRWRSGSLEASVSPNRLIHSARAILGSRVKHNPHLLSCTYVSGLSIIDDRALLSYGINDVTFGFSSVGVSRLLK